MECFICTKKAIGTCNDCDEKLPYCGQEHLHLHRPKSGSCYPFLVRHNETVGRYLIAGKDILPGEIIMRDDPLAVGPGNSVDVNVCVNCFDEVDAYVSCRICGLPLCSDECGEGPEHALVCGKAGGRAAYPLLFQVRMIIDHVGDSNAIILDLFS